MKKLQDGAIKADNTLYSAEEIKAHNDFVDLVTNTTKEQMANMISKEEADTLLKDAVEAVEAKFQPMIDKLHKAALEQGIELANQRNRSKAIVDDADIEKQLYENKDAIMSAVKGKFNHEMTLKTNYTRASVTSNPMGYMLNEYGIIGAPKLTIYDSMPKIPVGPESNGVVRYIDQVTGTRNAAAKAEGTALPESAVAWQGYTLNLEKIGTTIPVTEEAFRHTARLAAEVELFLQTDVQMAIESNLATGDGATPNLKGLYTSATTYTASAQSVTAATIYDLIVKMAEDITGSIIYGGKYMPNVCYMNIADINKMALTKDANYNYILPPFVTRDGRNVAGMTIIETPYITANTLVLGDSRFARIYEDGGYEIGFGYNLTGDFAKDILTIPP